MIVNDINDTDLSGYTHLISDKLQDRITFFNEILTDLYAGRTLFQYNIDEEVLLDILKNEYDIDGRSKH